MSATPAASQLPGEGTHVGVVGAGRTGVAVVEVLVEAGAQVTVYDTRTQPLTELTQRYAGTAVEPRLHTVAAQAEETAEHLRAAGLDLLIVSPGVPATGPILGAARDCGCEVWSEIELAWRLHAASQASQAPWLAITGTDGKTTTTGMLASILSAAGLRAPAVGNIGDPVITTVRGGAYDALAVELSSFQLHTTHSLSAAGAVCINLAPDHLDWHGSFEAYGQDKARIFTHAQRAAIYNCADPATRQMVENADVDEGCLAVGITLGIPSLGQVGVVEDMLVDRALSPQRRTHGQVLATFEDLAHLAPGHDASRLAPHIVCDALAAAALALSIDVPPAAIAQGLRDFRPGAHRNVIAAMARGITWIDDSKATNPHAAEASLRAHAPGSVVWIAGGDTKGADFHELVERSADRLAHVLLIGVDDTALRAALAEHAPQVPVTRICQGSAEEIIEQVTQEAARVAQPGQSVLLAPACASWDQFSSYTQRGDLFAAAAQQWAAQQQPDQVPERAGE